MDWTTATAPDIADIDILARETVRTLPDAFRIAANAVVIRVEEFATEAVLGELGIEDPFDLSGLYDGLPLTQKSISDPQVQPDVIWLFRRAILDEWAARGEVTLAELVSHVVVHELAHHFGWSDDDIASIDQWWL